MTSSLKSPVLSVILPVRNESGFIERTLDALFSQTMDKVQFEVIVANGLSDDGTDERIDSFQEHHPELNLSFIRNPQEIFASGFNLAYQKSKGQYIVMLGGHTCLSNDYLEKCSSILAVHPEIDCIGGVIETVGETRVAKAVAAAMSSRFGVGGVAFRTGIQALQETDTVAFGMYRRSVFEKAGLLDESMVKNQDDEFNYRIRAHGARIFISPDIRATYFSRAKLNGLFKQYFLYGFWKVRVLQKWPGQMRLRHFIPLAFVIMLLSLIPACFISFLQIPLLFLTSFYIILNLLASLQSSIRHKAFSFIFIIPLIFFILHLSYGLGFLIGLFRFIRSWKSK